MMSNRSEVRKGAEKCYSAAFHGNALLTTAAAARFRDANARKYEMIRILNFRSAFKV